MCFLKTQIKTFDLYDLVGRTLTIKSSSDNNCELIVAVDIKTGEMFVLEEIQRPIETIERK